MGQVKRVAYKIAYYMYEKGLNDEQIVSTMLRSTRSKDRQKAEEWLRKQIDYLRENPYPIRNMLE